MHAMHEGTIHKHKKPAYEDEGSKSVVLPNNPRGNHVGQKGQNTTTVAERRERASTWPQTDVSRDTGLRQKWTNPYMIVKKPAHINEIDIHEK